MNVVVMPAYRAARTVEKTVVAMPPIYDKIILCDDGSLDDTAAVAEHLGLWVMRHERNRGYGANQKTLYDAALNLNPSVVIMVHPDNQYDTSMLSQAVALVEKGTADVVLGTRMETAIKNGMPRWKRYGNALHSSLERSVFQNSLSEFHSGLRIMRADLLKQIPYHNFSDDFVFDSQFLAWCFGHHRMVAEIPTQCWYTHEASSINFRRSVMYGLCTVAVMGEYLLTTRYSR